MERDNWGFVYFRNLAGGKPPKGFLGKFTQSKELTRRFDQYNEEMAAKRAAKNGSGKGN